MDKLNIQYNLHPKVIIYYQRQSGKCFYLKIVLFPVIFPQDRGTERHMRIQKYPRQYVV